MPEQKTAEIIIHLEYIRASVDGINVRLDKLNGRTRQNEQDIAVLQDRASEARTAGRNWGLTAGGIGTAVAAALAYWFGGK